MGLLTWICRAKFCCVPVMKACGKKKPETQKTRGMPSSIHFRRKAIRAYKVRSHCRLTNRGTDYLSDSGMKRMSRWCTVSGSATEPCPRLEVDDPGGQRLQRGVGRRVLPHPRHLAAGRPVGSARGGEAQEAR
jgi:hypothetical protein